MRLFALAVAAFRDDDTGSVVSFKAALTTLNPGADIDALGQELAAHLFPPADGWRDHAVDALEVVPRMDLAPHRLIWRLEEES